MTTKAKFAATAVFLCAMTVGASAHSYVPGGYGYYAFGPYRHDAAQRFYPLQLRLGLLSYRLEHVS